MIFDVGGVLALDAPRHFLSELSVKEGVSIEELVAIWRRFFPPLLTGKITEDEFWKSFITELNLEVPAESLLSRFKNEIRLFILADKEFLAYLKTLKSQLIAANPKEKVTFAILSNNVKEWAGELEKQADLSSLFEIVIYSFEEHLTKPSPELYKKAISLIGIEPGKILFIDNKERNIDTAKAHGMIGLLFTTPQEFKDLMVQLKIAKS